MAGESGWAAAGVFFCFLPAALDSETNGRDGKRGVERGLGDEESQDRPRQTRELLDPGGRAACRSIYRRPCPRPAAPCPSFLTVPGPRSKSRDKHPCTYLPCIDPPRRRPASPRQRQRTHLSAASRQSVASRRTGSRSGQAQATGSPPRRLRAKGQSSWQCISRTCAVRAGPRRDARAPGRGQGWRDIQTGLLRGKLRSAGQAGTGACPRERVLPPSGRLPPWFDCGPCLASFPPRPGTAGSSSSRKAISTSLDLPHRASAKTRPGAGGSGRRSGPAAGRRKRDGCGELEKGVGAPADQGSRPCCDDNGTW